MLPVEIVHVIWGTFMISLGIEGSSPHKFLAIMYLGQQTQIILWAMVPGSGLSIRRFTSTLAPPRCCTVY